MRLSFVILAQLTAFLPHLWYILYLKWRFQSWGHFLSSLYQFSTRSSSMASVGFCKIPPLPWPSMASRVAWSSIDSIGWIPWKLSPIAPWIPQKLSVESMEIYRKRRQLIPLNFPLNVHCFFGSPWKWSPNTPWRWKWNPRNSVEISETGVVQQIHALSDVFWVTESKSISVFCKVYIWY